MNTAAQSLGRLGRGKKKTLTKAAIKQRRKAARISGKKRRGQPRNQPRDLKPQEIVVESAVTVEELKGHEAIDAAENGNVTLHKYADPVEPARDQITPDEAREIAKEDPSLIYGTTNTTGDESVPEVEKIVENKPLTEPVPSDISSFNERKLYLT